MISLKARKVEMRTEPRTSDFVGVWALTNYSGMSTANISSFCPTVAIERNC